MQLKQTGCMRKGMQMFLTTASGMDTESDSDDFIGLTDFDDQSDSFDDSDEAN